MYKTLSRHLQHGQGSIHELSDKTTAYEKRKNDKFATIASAHKGKIVSAKVTNILNYGAFVDVGGVPGFVHISELSKGKIHDIRSELKIGTVYEFKIIEVGLSKKGVLSLKLTKILDKPVSSEGRNKTDDHSFCSTPFSNLNHLISARTELEQTAHPVQRVSNPGLLHENPSNLEDYEDIKI